MSVLDREEEASRAAPDLENAVSRSYGRLIDELLPRAVAAEQLHDRIVERKEQVTSGRGHVRPPGFRDGLVLRRHGDSLSAPRPITSSRDQTYEKLGASLQIPVFFANREEELLAKIEPLRYWFH
jgi:hypothetical protein